MSNNCNILKDALLKCRSQFEYYRDQHIAKMTGDSLRKAATNQELVDSINETLRVYEQKEIENDFRKSTRESNIGALVSDI